MTIKYYSLEVIKDAYWKQFHRSGEHFFSYGDEESAQANTESSWDDFIYELAQLTAKMSNDGPI